jgi:hypothetical protein
VRRRRVSKKTPLLRRTRVLRTRPAPNAQRRAGATEIQKSNERVADCTLSGAQLLVARCHGFASWPKFVKHLEAMASVKSPVSEFESAVDAIVAGELETLMKLMRQNPELVRMRSTREHGSTLLHYVSANGVEYFRQKTPKNIVEVAKLLLDLSPFLRQTVKTQISLNGELSHGIVS